MSRKALCAVLFILTLIGGLLRFYNLDKNPVSLSVDEVSTGYNAYSILKTGRDEYGNFLPLSFRSLNDYKPPVFTYLVSISEALFGLNEFAVRFPSAFFGTISIPIFYLFFLVFLKDKYTALVSALLVAISPWHIFVSRVGWEYLLGTFLVVVGMLCLLKIDRGLKWTIGAALTLVLSMYTYHAQRFFVPLIVLVFFLLNRKLLVNKKKEVIIFLTILITLLIPLAVSFIFGPDKTRAQNTFITNDVEFIRNIKIDSLTEAASPFVLFDNQLLLFFHWIRKYLAYLQPSFLFFNGLNLTTSGTYGSGVIYLFELPFLILGIISLIKEKIQNKRLMLAWILIGLLPASLTLTEQHYGRSLIISPMLIGLSSIGIIAFLKFVNKHLSKARKTIFYIGFSAIIIWNLLLVFLLYTIHFPNQRGEDFMEGTKETVLYALKNSSRYNEIVFDPRRGVQGPYIISVPHLYILFYSKYDPAKFQREAKKIGDSFNFDKFTIRDIKWTEDKNLKNTLFIGSPWSFIEKDLTESWILERIYLKNGNRAFLIVSNP